MRRPQSPPNLQVDDATGAAQRQAATTELSHTLFPEVIPAPLPVAMLDDRQRLACLRLIRSENVGPVTFRELINHCGGAEAALAALPELSRKGGRRRPVRICPSDVAEAELEAAVRIGARPLFTIEPGFPWLLAQLEPPPPVIYVRGRVELLSRNAVAIVGSRNASAAGMTLARRIASELGAAGLVIVSGLARGIDGAAHTAALGSGTVAVLAGGLDHVYPPEHADLHSRIGEEGCLVSDRWPGFEPRGQDFPRRNAIIAGLSRGVVVIEAAKRSGTLTTARFARDQNREVMAVPGHPLDPRAEGTNGLLKQGAGLVTNASDVLEILAPLLRERRGDVFSRALAEDTVPADVSPMQHRTVAATEADAGASILSALGPAPVSVDALAQTTGLPVKQVRIALLELALAGRIEQHGGQLVSLRTNEDREGDATSP